MTVDVENVGSKPGREVVQLYLTAPEGALDKPPIELRGFAKTAELAPGETATVGISVDRRALMSFDESRGAWVAEAGTYTVHLGASSRDLRATTTFERGESFELAVRPALALPQPPDEISP